MKKVTTREGFAASFLRKIKQQTDEPPLENWRRGDWNFVALIPSRSIHQMLAIFTGLEF